MNSINEMGRQMAQTMDSMAGGNLFFEAALVLTMFTVFALAVSIVLKFMEPVRGKHNVEKVCLVSTLTMSFFFLSFLLLVRFRVGVYDSDPLTNGIYFFWGAFLVLGSTIFNIMARVHVKKYWSDKIVVHREHTILQDGPFGFVRHPMYASLILYGWGLAMMYMNYAMLLATLFIFVPMMVYRANAEERELSRAKNKDYAAYRKRVPFLMPILEHRSQIALRLLGVAFFAVVIVRQRFAWDEILFLSLFFGLISFFIDVPKVRYSYRMKTVVLLLIKAASLFFPNAVYFFYLIFLFAVMGMKYNCPAMYFYERAHPAKEVPRARLRKKRKT